MELMTQGSVKLRVPELLKERGWNISEFGRKADISYPTALRLAKGEADAITLDMIDKLCDVFGVTVEELILREV